VGVFTAFGWRKSSSPQPAYALYPASSFSDRSSRRNVFLLFSLMTTTEELFERKISDSGFENRD
jgi:hypothetical protein